MSGSDPDSIQADEWVIDESYLPSTITTLPLPNLMWNTRSLTANGEVAPVDLHQTANRRAVTSSHE